jgi:hypothetical protein
MRQFPDLGRIGFSPRKLQFGQLIDITISHCKCSREILTVGLPFTLHHFTVCLRITFLPSVVNAGGRSREIANDTKLLSQSRIGSLRSADRRFRAGPAATGMTGEAPGTFDVMYRNRWLYPHESSGGEGEFILKPRKHGLCFHRCTDPVTRLSFSRSISLAENVSSRPGRELRALCQRGLSCCCVCTGLIEKRARPVAGRDSVRPRLHNSATSSGLFPIPDLCASARIIASSLQLPGKAQCPAVFTPRSCPRLSSSLVGA